MVALTVPPGIPSDGSWRVWYVPTMAAPAVPDISSDIGNVATVDGSCLFVKAGGISIDLTADKYKDERLCTIQVFESIGQVTYTIPDITYVIDPQTPASATNALYAAVGAGGTGFFIVRFGMPAETAPAAAQKVWVIPVTFAPAVPLPPEANTMTRAKQSVTVSGVVQRDVALVA